MASARELALRTIGRRQERSISFSASAALLAEGARFNDGLGKLPTGATTLIPKGVFRFKTHEEANAHAEACLIEAIARRASERG